MVDAELAALALPSAMHTRRTASPMTFALTSTVQVAARGMSCLLRSPKFDS